MFGVQRPSAVLIVALVSGGIGCPSPEAPSAGGAGPEAAARAASRPSSQPAAEEATPAPTGAPGEAAQGEASGPAAERVEVIDAHARAMPPSASNSAAFMTLRNAGPSAALVRADADVSETVELHTHTHEDGVMKMRPVSKIELPAGEDTVLKPGGLHVMLIGLKQPMTAGDTFDLTLSFADESTRTVTVEVRAIEPPAP